MVYKISPMSEFPFTSMADTRCSTAWLANLFHPFHSVAMKMGSLLQLVDISNYLKLEEKESLLSTYLKLLLTAHKPGFFTGF